MKKDTGAFLGEGAIVATYPSGKTISSNGKLYFGQVPGTEEACPVVVPEGNEVLVLDPRAIVTVDGAIRYHPRAFGDQVSGWAAKWLTENPTWAPLGSLEGSEAPGAWPKGTRVRKAAFEDGDAHPVGALGTATGSVMLPDGRYFYAVRWDDNPNVPVHCLGFKIEKAE